MSKKIRDTIHGYIYLTRLEEAITQHPSVIRLHHVHQTSFTYLTYPNAHSTRYPHSLGVMHVAGEIFRYALLGTRADVLQKLSADLRWEFNREDLKIDREKIAAEFHSDQSAAADKKVLDHRLYRNIWSAFRDGTNAEEQERARIDLLLLYQGIRLAALLHDIGHPPYSHIVEYGFQEALGSRYLGHEQVGDQLIVEILKDDALKRRAALSRAPAFCEASLKIALAVLRAKGAENESAAAPRSPDEQSKLYGIKQSLISGELDADRLDYVRRDCYSAGLVPQYDIRRLLDSAHFEINDEQVFVAYSGQCLSAVENFFGARYDLYRWMIYHHDVVRRNICIQRGLRALLENADQLRETPKAIAAELQDFAVPEDGIFARRYSRFVDSYFLDALWRLDDFLEKRHSELTDLEQRLKLYTDVVLHRRNDRLPTLIKRTSDYEDIAEKYFSSTGLKPKDDRSYLASLNDLLVERFDKKYLEQHGKAVGRFRFAEDLEKEINKELANMAKLVAGVRVYYHGKFQAGPKPDFRIYDNAPNDPGVEVARVSPMLRMLSEAWRFSPHLTLFYEPGRGLTDVDTKDNARHVLAAVVPGLVRFLE